MAVGFNLDHRVPYFRIKNSWGKWWGQWGYFKIALSDDPHGKCNIAGSGKNFYPVLEWIIYLKYLLKLIKSGFAIFHIFKN